MCSRVCDHLSNGVSYVWNHFLAEDLKVLGEKAAEVANYLKFKLPQDGEAQRYIFKNLQNRPVVELPKLTNAYEIAYQIKLNKETREGWKRWAKAAVIIAGVTHLLWNQSLYGTCGFCLGGYVAVKLINKGLDKWYERTNEADIRRLDKAVADNGIQPPAHVAAAASPNAW